MDEMITFFRSLTNVTLSAAAIGSLYPQDLYVGTDWMLQSSGTHRPLPVIYFLSFLRLEPQSFLQLWRQTWKEPMLDLTTLLWASVKRSARCVTSQQWGRGRVFEAARKSPHLELSWWRQCTLWLRVSCSLTTMKYTELGHQTLVSGTKNDVMRAHVCKECCKYFQNIHSEFELLPQKIPEMQRRKRHKRSNQSTEWPAYVTMQGPQEGSVVLKYPREVLEISSKADNTLGLPSVGLYRAEFATISTLIHAGRNSIEQ